MPARKECLAEVRAEEARATRDEGGRHRGDASDRCGRTCLSPSHGTETACRSRTWPTPFVVFMTPRSGSSWLIDLLDSHPRIAAHAQLFIVGDRAPPDYGSRDVPRFEATLDESRGHGRATLLVRRVRFLNRLFDRRPGAQTVGFELMYLQASSHTGLVPYLAARRAQVVHLVRANALDQIVSYEAALARNVFRARRGDVVPEVTVRLDAPTLPARLESMESEVVQAQRTLARYRLPVVEVVYEHLAVATEDELARVVSFLGVEPTDWQAESSLVGANRLPRDELIENIDEVAAALASTRFAWMLD